MQRWRSPTVNPIVWALLRRTGFAASTRHFAGSISLWDNEGGTRALLVSQRAGLTGAALTAKITFA